MVTHVIEQSDLEGRVTILQGQTSLYCGKSFGTEQG